MNDLYDRDVIRIQRGKMPRQQKGVTDSPDALMYAYRFELVSEIDHYKTAYQSYSSFCINRIEN